MEKDYKDKVNQMWEEIKKESPLAFDRFNKWTDDYKRLNDWNDYFLPGIKLHDIPLNFQFDLIMLCFSTNGKTHVINIEKMKEAAKGFFQDQENLLKTQS